MEHSKTIAAAESILKAPTTEWRKEPTESAEEVESYGRGDDIESANTVNIWPHLTVPKGMLSGEKVVFTPNVGDVRIVFDGGDTVDGQLHCVGAQKVVVDARLGRLTLDVHRIDRIDRLGSHAGGTASTKGLERVRVQAEGGTFLGHLLSQEGDQVSVLLSEGRRVTLVSDDIRLVGRQEKIVRLRGRLSDEGDGATVPVEGYGKAPSVEAALSSPEEIPMSQDMPGTAAETAMVDDAASPLGDQADMTFNDVVVHEDQDVMGNADTVEAALEGADSEAATVTLPPGDGHQSPSDCTEPSGFSTPMPPAAPALEGSSEDQGEAHAEADAFDEPMPVDAGPPPSEQPMTLGGDRASVSIVPEVQSLEVTASSGSAAQAPSAVEEPDEVAAETVADGGLVVPKLTAPDEVLIAITDEVQSPGLEVTFERGESGASWPHRTVPNELLSGEKFMFTPCVGQVRILLDGKKMIEGRLHGIGAQLITLDMSIGRLTLDSRRVDRVERVGKRRARLAASDDVFRAAQ